MTSRAPFSTEAEMAPRLRPHVRTLTGTPVLWFTEVPAVNGIPDVTLVRFDPAETRRRSRHGLTMPEDLACVRVAQALTDAAAEMDITEISKVTRLSEAVLRRRVLPMLAAHGWTVRAGTGWVMSRRYSDPAALLVTIELKRRDWKKALAQAVQASTGADQSWVVLDAHASSVTRHRNHFDVRGVGLALLDRKDLTVVHSPRPVTYDPARRAVLAERLLHMRAAGVEMGPERHVFGRVLG